MLGVRVSAVGSLAQPDSAAAIRWQSSSFYPIENMLEIAGLFNPLTVN